MTTRTLVDSSSAPLKREASFYRPELDALRFFACLCVFIHHAGGTRNFIISNPWTRPLQKAGAFGVCLFFLLSAYLITELLWKERDKTGSIHLRSFYLRRILRIWPLYFGCILLYVVLIPFFPGASAHPYMLLALLFMAGNWYFAANGWVNFAIDPVWSISVEEQFYLLVPTIAKFGGKRAIWILSIFLLIASQLMLLFLGFHHVKAAPEVWTNSVVQVQFFAAGCLLALVLKDRKTVWNRGLVRLAAFLLALILWGIAGDSFHLMGGYPFEPSTFELCAGYGLVLIGTVLLFLAVYGISSRWIPRWAIYLGKISFGLYLFQGFTFDLAQHSIATPFINRLKYHIPVADLLIEIGLTLLMAALSYRFFEKPFLRLKNRFEIVLSRPA